MEYDFDTVINRRKYGDIKWNVGEDELPMWVADMDFRSAPEILKALDERLKHGVFGYTSVTDEWYSAYADWWRERYGFIMDKSRLAFCSGVVLSITAAIGALTGKGDGVVLMTPVYNAFFNCIKRNGCRLVENPLRYENGTYSVDFEDLEKKLSDPAVKVLILCNPHNPVGKIWDKETLAKIGSLCRSHGVTVISDEIHCDITRPGMKYTPFCSVSEECAGNCIMCIAPTKTFNLAGLHTAAVYVPDKSLFDKVREKMSENGCDEVNAFAEPAAVAAYKYCGEWADRMFEYVFENRRIAEEAVNAAGAKAVKGDATYLLWIDTGVRGADVSKIIREKTGLYMNSGLSYGAPGDGFVRMNLACPRSVLYDGLDRFARAMKAL